jgi:prepilin-type N-terminal cleavage/methylation domain-containing protein
MAGMRRTRGRLAGRRRGASGFTLVELLVVIAIVLILVGLLMAALARAQKRKYEVLAEKTVHDIAHAAMLYSEWASGYPPDTGNVRADGSTSAFTSDEEGPYAPSGPSGCVAEAIYRYLGVEVRDVQSGQTHKDFLLVMSRFVVEAGDDRLFVDPWGNPYQMDSLHVLKESGAPVMGRDPNLVDQDVKIVKVGAPYDPSLPITDWKKDVKVWCFGPPEEPSPGAGDDRMAKAKPYSHEVDWPTGDPLDANVIISW